MKTNYFLYVIVCIIMSSCSQIYRDKTNLQTEITDTVQVQNIKFESTFIGEDVWMTSNLNTQTFRNGDTIPIANTIGEWFDACNDSMPVRYVVKLATNEYRKILGLTINDEHNKDSIEFVLYNYYAVYDKRMITPTGWKVPSRNDWIRLLNTVGSEKYLLDEKWVTTSFGNTYNFCLMPTPMGMTKNGYDIFPSFSFFWTISDTVIGMSTLYTKDESYDFDGIVRWRNILEYDALPIRCIKE